MNEEQSLIALVEDTPEFTTIHEHFTRFNPFRVLQVDQYEIRHSNMLGWLLDANANHQLGQYFLRKFLVKVFLHEDNFKDEDKTANYDVVKLLQSSFHDVKVYREKETTDKKRIDLLVVSERSKFALLIENKYWANESEEQLENYLSYVKLIYPEYELLPVFLTLQDSDPTHNDYLKVGYRDVLAILHELLERKQDVLSTHVFQFIHSYKEILEDQLLENDELTNLALEVFQSHKDAIQLVLNNNSSHFQNIYTRYQEAIDFIAKVGNSITKHAFKEFVSLTSLPIDEYYEHFRLPNFILKSWAEPFSEQDLRQKWWLNKGMIAWFERVGEKCRLKVEVGPIEAENRIKFLNCLEEQGILIREKAKNESTKFTGIYMDDILVESWEDRFSITSAMKELTENDRFQVFIQQVDRAISKYTDVELTNDEATFAISHTVTKTTQQETLSFGQKKQNPSISDAFEMLIGELETKPAYWRKHNSLPMLAFEEWATLPKRFEVESSYWLGYPLISWFERKNDNLRLIVEVGPIKSPYRNELLQKMVDADIVVRPLAFKEGAKYSRIYTESVVVDEETTESLLVSMRKLYEDEKYQRFTAKLNSALFRIN